MSSGCKIFDQYAHYFCTFTIVEWADIFSRQVYRDIVAESFNHCIACKGLQVHGYVFMSNHIHSILSATNGNLSGIIRDLKRFTSSKISQQIRTGPESRADWLIDVCRNAALEHSRNSELQVWRQNNHPELLLSQKFLRQKLNYIHQNPVRAGLVLEPQHWVYSSAADYCFGKQVGPVEVSLLDLTL